VLCSSISVYNFRDNKELNSYSSIVCYNNKGIAKRFVVV
jgi:hypothetical protein